MVAKERKRLIELAKLTVKKISMDKINIDKNHKQVVLRADKHMAIQHRKKMFSVTRSQINANLNKKAYTPYLIGKNHTHPMLGKVEYKLVEHFWKAIWP